MRQLLSSTRNLTRVLFPLYVLKFMESQTASNYAACLLSTIKKIKENNPRLALLDLGASSGSMLAAFPQIIEPEGHAAAMDVNPVKIYRAKVVVEQRRVTNLSFQIADAYELPFEDRTFISFIAIGFDQWDILRKMLRVTKPSGVVAAREGDVETEVMWPPFSIFPRFHHACVITIE
ncbi:hypothetical protein HD806DRAFT_532811 [Xylariaceae sp. AK1471]|nr:hypothetical protein HD806DRAFT_532811 [Xylariaceae sp. AK1471]